MSEGSTAAAPVAGSPGALRNRAEEAAAHRLVEIFEGSADSTADQLRDFPKYVRRQDLTKLLVRAGIFEKILNVPGSIVECGVFGGAGVFTWANLSAIREPNNIMRRVIGFDTFDGFPSVAAEDLDGDRASGVGDLRSNSYDELVALIAPFDDNRFLGHVPKIELVRGDANTTIPTYVEDNPHLVVSLLYLDFDLYEPTKVALETMLPRMPRGAVVAFDELNNRSWPGETTAALQNGFLSSLRLERFDFDPYVAFAVL